MTSVLYLHTGIQLVQEPPATEDNAVSLLGKGRPGTQLMIDLPVMARVELMQQLSIKLRRLLKMIFETGSAGEELKQPMFKECANTQVT